MSSRLEEMIALGRRIQPPAGAEDRMWTSLQPHIAGVLASLPVVPDDSLHLARGATLKILAGVVVATGLGGLLLSGLAEAPARRESERLSASDEPRVPPMAGATTPWADPPRSGPETPALLATPAVRGAPVRKPRVARPREPVAALLTARAANEDAEIALLERLHAERDPHRKLQLAELHHREFPTGDLVRERLACQVDALCALGRRSEARRIAAELLSRWPRSQHAVRIEASCAAADTP